MKGPKTRHEAPMSSVPLPDPRSARTDTRNPIGIEPTSPRKIRAGGQFLRRNPAAEADRRNDTSAPSPSPPLHDARPRHAPPIAVIAPASPSIPSMKL